MSGLGKSFPVNSAKVSNDIEDVGGSKVDFGNTSFPAPLAKISNEISKVKEGLVTVESLSVTKNDTYTAPEGVAYSPIIVNVPGEETVIEGKLNTIISADNFDEMHSLISSYDVAIMYFKIKTTGIISFEQQGAFYVSANRLEGQKRIECGNCSSLFLGTFMVYKLWSKVDDDFTSEYHLAIVDFESDPFSANDLSETLDENVNCRMVLINRE